jgi:manganese/iron transport system permease protein
MNIITEALIGPFQNAFMLRALVVAVLVGVMCPILGAYVVVRGLGFMGDGLAHGVLPGMAAAVLIGAAVGVAANTGGIYFLGALPAALAMALLSGYLIRRVGVSEDTSVGILFAGMFALGLVMLTAARGVPVNLEAILLGNVLGVSQPEMLVTLGLAAAVLVVMFLMHKELVFASFDPLGSSVIGLPTEKLDYLLLSLLAVVVVLALPAVGIVLVIAMLITPAAAAALLVRSFPAAMITGALMGAASAIAGMYISFHFNLPSGPVMALVATVFFILAVAWKQRLAGLLQRQRGSIA